MTDTDGNLEEERKGENRDFLSFFEVVSLVVVVSSLAPVSARQTLHSSSM